MLDAGDLSNLVPYVVVVFRTAVGMNGFSQAGPAHEVDQSHGCFQCCAIARAIQGDELRYFANENNHLLEASRATSAEGTCLVNMPSTQGT